MRYKLDFQDIINIEFAKALIDKLEKAGKMPPGPTKWVGEEGFNTCVAHLSKKKGITNAKALCGALKARARETGQLNPEHMGRIEKKEYMARKK